MGAFPFWNSFYNFFFRMQLAGQGQGYGKKGHVTGDTGHSVPFVFAVFVLINGF